MTNGSFRPISNYTTLKLKKTDILSITHFRPISNYTTLKLAIPLIPD